MLRVAILVLTFALVSGVGLRAHERAEGDPLVSGGDNNALAPSTSPEKAAFQASKNYRVQLRDRAKPELQNLKKYYTNDWESDKNLLRYEKDCLTDLAPKSLALRATAEDTEFCNSFQQTHKGFADSVRRVLAMLPLPSTRESIEAEMEAEMDEDEAAEDSSLLELETNAAIPGNPNLRWPTNKIPFCLDDSLEEDERVSFLWGVKHLQQNFHPSCITLELVKCDDEVHKVWVKHRKWRCFSAIGLRTSQARQRILWSDACDPGSAAHEMLHSLGFGHTMGRLDRDNYVTVDLTHVRKNRLYNFRKYNPPFQDYGPYDFGSILHYHDTMFIPFKKLQADSDIRSMRERLPRPPGVPEPLGTPWNGQAQREALSEADVSAVKMMYSCPASSAPVPSPAAAPAAGAPAEQTPPAAAVVTDVSSS